MYIDLYKSSRSLWIVKNSANEDAVHYASIEEAANFLESVGVLDEEIDYALASLAQNWHNRARFSLFDGKFNFSDNEEGFFPKESN